MAERIGFIGLGQMGKWMAHNILGKGFDLTISDIDATAVTALTEGGAKSAATPAEVAERTDWIFLSLPKGFWREKQVSNCPLATGTVSRLTLALLLQPATFGWFR